MLAIYGLSFYYLSGNFEQSYVLNLGYELVWFILAFFLIFIVFCIILWLILTKPSVNI